MFENMVKSATFPVIWEALNAVDHELNGVQERLDKLIAKSDDDVTTVLAKQQVNLLQGLAADDRESAERPAPAAHRGAWNRTA